MENEGYNLDGDSAKKLLNEAEKFDEYDEKYSLTRTLQKLMHFLKVSVGTGILGLPVAVKNAGVVVGPIAMFIVAVVTTHCMLLLIESARKLARLSGRTSLDYGETAEECVRLISVKHAKVGRFIVNVSLWITQIGICTVFVLFVVRNIEQVLIHNDIIDLGVTFWILILCPFLLGFIMIRKLSSLVWVSAAAKLFMAFSIVSIFVHLIRNVEIPSELKHFGGWSNFPLFFGVTVFAFGAIPIVFPLENCIREPETFPSVVKPGMAIVTIIYLAVGFFGYLTCQHECKGSVTFNLPGTPFFTAVRLLVTIAMFFSYFIQAFVPLKIVQPWITNHLPKKTHFMADTLVRILLVFTTCGLAAAIPQLDNVISLVGSFSMSLLGYVYPIAIHSYVFYRELSRLKLAKDVLILLFGVLGCVAGTYLAIENIVEELN